MAPERHLGRVGHFKNLKAYQHAQRLAIVSRSLIGRLPGAEHDLADQWRRAANSVALNLAEGATRRGPKEFRRYADIARGSLHEIEAIIDMLLALNLFQAAELQELIAVRDECARTVYGLVRKFSTPSS